LIERYPVRGLKGAVGTQLDQLTLFKGDAGKVIELEDRVLTHLGLQRSLRSVGQVYPRSLDFGVISALYQLGSGPASFAKTLRLMAGHDMASEGFAPGQVGSSAMPHKMNSRSCERLNGLHVILRGHLAMAEGLAGDQWNEGDVSCSVVRRVMLPDGFFAIDGLLETFLTILDQMEVNVSIIEREVRQCLPFLTTTTILMEAVKAGVGRETAHHVIREHSIATSQDLRSGRILENDLFRRLAHDPRLGLDEATLERLGREARAHSGAAGAQVDWFVRAVMPWGERFPAAARLKPEPIL
jgi:adenylosuccinate lyase